MNNWTMTAGSPTPFGTSYHEDILNFAVYCPFAAQIKLCLFSGDQSLLKEISFDPKYHRTGDIWHIAIAATPLPLPLLYGYKVNGNDTILLDPYAKETSSPQTWRGCSTLPILGVLPEPAAFDWEDDVYPNIPMQNLIIYEMHVRAFTADRSSNVSQPGTYSAIIEKIPYLRDLGINALEFLPIQEFNENDCIQINPATQQSLCNFWGYSTLNFFTPMKRYASKGPYGTATKEFKTLVKTLHKNGIEVFLDIVFNHTGEGNEKGPVISFKGLANSTYYIYSDNEGYFNYSGCGNTFNCNHPVIIELIINCLRYWVTEMHVDGFRFDLASIFSRNENGEPLLESPLIKAIAEDPILAKRKLIAEPWDAAGLYQLGRFYPKTGRWSEWNGQYRDIVRRFIKGTPGTKSEFATKICGSQDLFSAHSPINSINFVTAHDGFTLHDLVSYNKKHNEMNGESNHDGSSFNDSWNCGIEGKTKDPKILELRNRQMRNFHLTLMLSLGVPMLYMGDEYGHTKEGNNNSWCQDNEISWFLWNKVKEKKDFFRFYHLAIQFRKNHSFFQCDRFLTNADIEWHGETLDHPNWGTLDNLIAYTLTSSDGKEKIFAAFNASEEEKKIQLPSAIENKQWCWVCNTALPSPHDFNENPQEFPVQENTYTMMPYSSILLFNENPL